MVLSLVGAPNTRVQRTRSSASRRRSPLTRSPLGGRWLRVAFAPSLLTLIFCLPRVALACQCGARRSVAEAVAEASDVVAGMVVRADQAKVHFTLSGSIKSAVVDRVVLRVQKRWKGTSARELQIYSLSNCAFGFQQGMSYLVYASGRPSGGYLEASRCSRTQRCRTAREDLGELGPAK